MHPEIKEKIRPTGPVIPVGAQIDNHQKGKGKGGKGAFMSGDPKVRAKRQEQRWRQVERLRVGAIPGPSWTRCRGNRAPREWGQLKFKWGEARLVEATYARIHEWVGPIPLLPARWFARVTHSSRQNAFVVYCTTCQSECLLSKPQKLMPCTAKPARESPFLSMTPCFCNDVR